MNDIAPFNTLAGHNSAGIPLAELLADEIASDKARADEMIASATAAKIATHDDAGKVATLVGLIRNHERKLDQDREAKKRPYLDGGRTVDNAYSAVIRPLAQIRETLTGMLTRWQRQCDAAAQREASRIEAERRQQAEAAERARLAAEEARGTGSSIAAELAAIAAQERAEALMREAEMVRPAPIRTAFGAVAMRREIAFDVVDLEKLLGWLLKHRSNEIAEATRAIVGKHLHVLGVDAVERGIDIPGVTARIERRAQLR